MKRIFQLAVLVLVVLCGWLFYQYKQLAGQAEEQVLTDIRWIEQGFNEAQFKQEFGDKTLLQSQLVQQTIDDQQRYVRQYHSEFIFQGKRSCIRTDVYYPNKQAHILLQTQLADGELCLP